RFAPVTVGEDVVTADLAAGLDLAAGRYGPVEERVVACDALAARGFLDVLEERREAPDELSLVERLSDAAELIERDAGLLGARSPQVTRNLVRRELAFERGDDAPFEVIQLDEVRVRQFGQVVRLRSRLHAAPPRVSDAEDEERFGGHDAIGLCVDTGREEVTVLLQREALRDLQRRPEAVLRALGLGVGSADDDVA